MNMPYSDHEARQTMELLEDFKPGPLDVYRQQASFSWKEMAVTVENPVTLGFKLKIWETLANDPLFQREHGEMSFEQYRSITTQRVLKLLEYDFLPQVKLLASPNLSSALTIALQQYDGSVAAKRSILIDFFTNAIRGLGTGRHYDSLDAAANGKLFGCVAITEVGHGSNTRGLRTTATYDTKTQTFILHTPDFLAAKCWAGNLGKTACHACVTAKLITPDGECHGLASFLVAIRDPKTLLPYPGVTISDLGPKNGLNGLDNGLLIFKNYSIPGDSLLNKIGDVSPAGKFIPPVKFSDPSKRFGASLGNLSAARAGLIPMIAQLMCDALTISVRYSCVRRQFGKPEQDEIAIIEYQTQQYRLIPYVAAAYVLKFFGHSIFDQYVSFLFKSFSDPDKETVRLLGNELHILSAAAKPLASWLARDAVQEARECCGGHGYLKLSGLLALRNDNDANLTHEGDNHVLLQQTSNWLLGIWTKKNRINTQTPLNTLSFLQYRDNYRSLKFMVTSKQDLLCPEKILEMHKWLICTMLESTSDKYNEIYMQTGGDAFTSKNESQIHYAKPLSLIFIEHYILEHFYSKLCKQPNLTNNIHAVLQKIMCLYGLFNIEKYLCLFYEKGYMRASDATLVKETVLHLCQDLKPEVVALVDAVAPPDFVLNSVLGVSDGEVYKHLQNALMQTPGAFTRDENWESLSKRLGITSKL